MVPGWEYLINAFKNKVRKDNMYLRHNNSVNM